MSPVLAAFSYFDGDGERPIWSINPTNMPRDFSLSAGATSPAWGVYLEDNQNRSGSHKPHPYAPITMANSCISSAALVGVQPHPIAQTWMSARHPNTGSKVNHLMGQVSICLSTL